MINFDAVEFSERRSEEVISFFWRSVYIIVLIYNVVVFAQLYLFHLATKKQAAYKQATRGPAALRPFLGTRQLG